MSWKNYEELIKEYNFIVIERPNHIINQTLNNVIYYKSNQTEDISSTYIRNKIKNGEDISKYLDKKVFEYIKQDS